MRHSSTISDKAVVSSKGQVVIPRALREALGIHSGNELIFSLRNNNVLEVRLQRRSIEKFFGRCKQPKHKAISVEEMDEAILQAVKENDDKSRKKTKRGKK